MLCDTLHVIGRVHILKLVNVEIVAQYMTNLTGPPAQHTDLNAEHVASQITGSVYAAHVRLNPVPTQEHNNKIGVNRNPVNKVCIH